MEGGLHLPLPALMGLHRWTLQYSSPKVGFQHLQACPMILMEGSDEFRV